MSAPPLSSLENRAIRGVFWSAMERLGPQAVEFVVLIVLLWLVEQEDSWA